MICQVCGLEEEGSGGRVCSGGSEVGGSVGVSGSGSCVGPVLVVRGVRGAEQDRMTRDDTEEVTVEVFDYASGGMRIANCWQYRTSYYVEGVKYWDPKSRRKRCLVSTNVSNRRSGIRGQGTGRRRGVGVLVEAEFG